MELRRDLAERARLAEMPARSGIDRAELSRRLARPARGICRAIRPPFRAQRSEVKTWLHRIVVNSCLMKIRSAVRAQEQPIDQLLPQFDANGGRIEAPWSEPVAPDEALEQHQMCAIVRAKIAELPDSYRIVLLLRDIEELSTEEVAGLLGLSGAAVKVRLHRARSALKKLIEPILRRGGADG